MTTNGEVLDINSIRTVYPKDNHEWMNWINQGKLLWVDKSKIQALFTQWQMNAANVGYFDLDSARSITQNFANPQQGPSGNAAMWSAASVEDEIRGISRDEINKWRAKVGLRPLEKPASVAVDEMMRDAVAKRSQNRPYDNC